MLVSSVCDREGRNNKRACGNCGGSGHRPKTDQCPATGKRCSACGKFDHYAKCCRSTTSTSGVRDKSKARSARSQRFRMGTKSVNRVDDEAEDPAPITTVYVASVTSRDAVGEYKYVACRLNGVDTRLILDLGAKVSLLNGDQYKRRFSNCPLHPADLTFGYNGSRITCHRSSIRIL
jgi:hypothetical protein